MCFRAKALQECLHFLPLLNSSSAKQTIRTYGKVLNNEIFLVTLLLVKSVLLAVDDYIDRLIFIGSVRNLIKMLNVEENGGSVAPLSERP